MWRLLRFTSCLGRVQDPDSDRLCVFMHPIWVLPGVFPVGVYFGFFLGIAPGTCKRNIDYVAMMGNSIAHTMPLCSRIASRYSV